MAAVDSSRTLSESLVQDAAPSAYRSGKVLVCLSFLIGFCAALLLKPVSYNSGWDVQRGGLHEPAIDMANLVQQRQALSRQPLLPAPFQQSFSQGLRNNVVARSEAATDEDTETKKKPKMMPYLRPRKPKIDIKFFAATALNFVETHEYKVKPGMGPLFEKNFAARKTELFYIKGFQNFIVMRRVQAPQESDAFTYCVITSWKEQMYYDAWMQGKKSRNYFRKALTKGLTTGPEGHPIASNYFARSFFPKEPPSVRYLTGGPGSQMGFTGEKELEPQLFVSMRKYGDFESDDEIVGTAESLNGQKGFRYAQILENPAGMNEAKQVLLSVWESKADYEASILPKSKTPPLGEALYEGTLVLEQPRNF